jgi:hypothetical protein
MGEVRFRDTLTPLSVATRAVQAAVYPDSTLAVSRLSSIAHVMAALIPMYSYDPKKRDEPRLLDGEELLSGYFCGRFQQLHFRDGRTPIRNVAVKSADIPQVIAVLGHQQGVTPDSTLRMS